MDRGGRSSRLGYRPELDGLRGIAILLVVLAHAYVPGFLYGDQVGVTLFFVLSGFLITSLLLEELDRTGTISLRSFYRRRLLRLAPAFLVMVATVTAANLVVGAPGTLRNAALALAYVGNWSVAASDWVGNLNHTWTLAIEEQFYVVWPVALLLLATRLRLSRRAIGALLAAVIVVLGIERIALVAAGVTLDRIVFGSDTRADALLIGCLLATGFAAASRVPHRAILYAAAAAILILALLVIGMPLAMEWRLLVIALAAAGLLGAALRDPLLRRLLAWRPLVGVGRISYGMYLWNVPLMWALFAHVEPLALPVRTVIIVGSNIGLAAASYVAVERPFLRVKARSQPESTERERPTDPGVVPASPVLERSA